LLPANPSRDTVAVAEQLLGWVDERKEGETAPALAFGSRLSFSMATLPDGESGRLDSRTVLQILGSPKLPCPVMYFKNAQAPGHIKKNELTPAKHLPQGRKWYLHAREEKGMRTGATHHPDESKKQKNLVEPISAGQRFFFHLDFYNLTNHELGLLLYALEPDTTFHHKLGMGKPLGLGSVKIEVLSFCRIDRSRRYSLDGAREPRYHQTQRTAAGQALVDEGKWPGRYSQEQGPPEASAGTLDDYRQKAKSEFVLPDIHNALCLLGNFAAAPTVSQVHYPTIAGQIDHETEHYRWFVFNDGHKEQRRGMDPKGQQLPPLTNRRELPQLTELDWERLP